MELVLIVVLTGAVACYLSIKLGVGTAASPGPGFFPLIMGLLTLFFGVIVFVQKFRRKEAFTFLGGLSKEELRKWIIITVYLICIVVYPFGLKYVGYLPSTIVALMCFLALAGSRKWLLNLIISGVFSVVSYFAFQLLGVYLP